LVVAVFGLAVVRPISSHKIIIRIGARIRFWLRGIISSIRVHDSYEFNKLKIWISSGILLCVLLYGQKDGI